MNENNETIQEEGQETPQEQEMENLDPIEMGRRILAIEARLKDEISVIQEILALIVKDKLDLNKLKKIAKEKLSKLSNEEE